MRILAATLLLAAACGGPRTKHEGAVVQGGSDLPATCCCKTMPDTSDKDIVPNYNMSGRMECSTQHGECVDDVQCNAAAQPAGGGAKTQSADGVPPPPDLPPSK